MVWSAAATALVIMEFNCSIEIVIWPELEDSAEGSVVQGRFGAQQPKQYPDCDRKGRAHCPSLGYYFGIA